MKTEIEKEKYVYYWYIIFVRGGKEEKVIESIKSEIEKKGNKFFGLIEKLESIKDIMKGYILCRCYLTSDLVSFIYEVENVIGFLNHNKNEKNLPQPISEKIIKNALFSRENKKKENITEARKLDLKLNIGDSVIIMKGSFSNREGKIISLDEEKEIVGVEVNFLGQKTTIILPIVNCQRK